MYYTESYVFTWLGDYGRAGAAQDAALGFYRPEDLISPAQVELMRALCLVRAGDTAAGVAHARDVVGRLPYRSRPVVDLGRTVLEAVPAGRRHGGDARELRELVGGR
jgi:hypothetical protein